MKRSANPIFHDDPLKGAGTMKNVREEKLFSIVLWPLLWITIVATKAKGAVTHCQMPKEQ